MCLLLACLLHVAAWWLPEPAAIMHTCMLVSAGVRGKGKGHSDALLVQALLRNNLNR